MKTFEELQKLSKSDFDIEIAKIEKARKEYLKSDEYTEILRDKGEQIMRILIKDNCNTALNLGCSLKIIKNTQDPDYKPMCLEGEFEKTKELYLAGEETTAVMNQANSLIQKIIKVYYS